MSSIKVRVGQQNSVKIISSLAGDSTFVNYALNSVNVIGGIASVTQLNVSGISTFVGVSTFKNDVYIDGNLYVTNDLVFDEFTARNATITNNLSVGQNANITGILTVGQYLYYPPGEPYGVAYFDLNDRLVSTGSTSSSIQETNYILSTNSSGVPTWASVIDGGEY
jgi:hypothetical protein